MIAAPITLTQALPVYKPAFKTKKRFVCLYGGSGSSKSVFSHQKEVAKLRDGPQRLVVVRKVKDTLRRSCFQLFKDVISDLNWSDDFHILKHDMVIEGKRTKSIAWFVGMDDPEKLKSITSPTRFLIEEGTELSLADIEEIDRRLRGPGAEQITINFNPVLSARGIFEYVGIPEADLPTRSFVEGDDAYVQHTTYLDNPFIGEDYVKVFRRQGGIAQKVYELGELVSSDDPDQLIKWEWVKAAFEREPAAAAHDGEKRLSVDVGRFGDDPTVMYLFDGYAATERFSFNREDTTTTGKFALSKAMEHDIKRSMVGIDTVGVGGGVADTMTSEGFKPVEIIAGAAPVDIPIHRKLRFKNLRSQMWWYARECLQNGLTAICIEDKEAKKLLQEDLTAVHFRYGQDKTIEVEPKDGGTNWSIRNRLKRSCDDGDAFVQGLFVEHIKGRTTQNIQIAGF